MIKQHRGGSTGPIMRGQNAVVTLINDARRILCRPTTFTNTWN